MAFTVKRTIKKVPDKEQQDLAGSVSSGRSTDDTIETSSRTLRLMSENKRAGQTVSNEELELLYRLDGITFRITQKYIEKMLREDPLIKGGVEHTRGAIEDFIERINIKYICSQIIRDIFITGAGTAWTELGYNKDGTDIVKVQTINPKSMDFIRDDDGNILYDETLRPVGYKLSEGYGYPAMRWTKDRIEAEGEVIWRSKGVQDGRDRIAYWKLIGVGEEQGGMSPLEPVYKSALIRMNLEDTVGASALRGQALAAYVGMEDQDPREISDDAINKVRDKLAKVDQDTVWAFKRNVELTDFPSPDLNEYQELMYYFADVNTSGPGVGLPLILQPLNRGYRGDVDVKKGEFMDSVNYFQDILAHQVREQLFKRVLRARGISTLNTPRIEFRTKESSIALSTSRRLSTYARQDLLTHDPVLEAYIRDLEGLPQKPNTEEE